MTTTIDYVNWNWISFLFLGVTASPSTKQWLCIFMFTMTGSVEPLLLCHSLSLLLLLLFFLVFPDSSVLSTLFLGQIRLSCIPGIPAAYVRNSIQLLWARKVSPFPSLYPSPIPYASNCLHLVRTRQGQTWLLCRDHLHPPSLLPFSLSVSTLSEWGSQTEPHDSQCGGLETGFYTRGNGAKGDSTPSKTQKNELIRYCGRAFLARAWRIRKRKDTLELNRQDVRVTEKWLWWCVNRRVWMIRVQSHREWLTF